MTTTPTQAPSSLDDHGLAAGGTRRLEPDDRRSSTRHALKRGLRRARARWPARRRHRQAHRPLAEGQVRRPRARLARSGSGGARSTSRSPEEQLRRPAREGRRAPRGAGSALRRRCLRRRRRRPPDRRAGDHRRARTTPSSRRRCSSRRRPEETAVARARRRRAARARRSRPIRRATAPARGTFVVLHPTRGGGADRRHVLRRRDQEGDLHGHERPAAARGRAADALLGERRRGRARSRSSSASRAPARRRSPPTRSAR